jgi:anti-sigma-K factor RskA
MSNRQSPRLASNELFSVSSSAVLQSLYAGRERGMRPTPVISRRAPAPEAIWGQFNNYRSNGVVGSAVVHVVVLGIILSGVTFSHQPQQQVRQRETVTLIAPLP